MKRRLISMVLVVLLVACLSVPAFAASTSYSKSLKSGAGGYICYCDITSLSSTSDSWYVFSPSSSIKVTISSNTYDMDIQVHWATSGGNYLYTDKVDGTGSVSYSYSSDCVVRLENIGTKATTLTGRVTTS